MDFSCEVAVIGAGHAGIEAALATARLGHDTVLFTMNLDSLGNMPCNPSIGGTGKGHLVYEIDALGGEMGYAADKVTLQSRTLNLGKGAAVHSKRIQADRRKYQDIMKKTVEKTENLRLIQAEIIDFTCEEANGRKKLVSVTTKLGEVWKVDAAIICAGTYLASQIFVGDVVYDGGPDGMMGAKGLTDTLIREGLSVRRFKTGTPARVHRDSIDFSKLEEQPGEDRIIPYSSKTPTNAFDGLEQLPCHIVYTNADTHKLIRDNIHKSAMYSGNIHGIGPRYCPSIEDKINRFADKERHQLFVEPMGENTDEMYIQGFSTSMPSTMQYEMLRSLKGFENARIMRYAYAIEYDCIDPTELYPTLEFKQIAGLFGAGQFNGTSGYEEAAAQGLVAGINAALALEGREPMILERSSSYIGTLIDDLVTKGTNEPYRIMTSRSEYRLLLRQDNADMRLTDIGHKVGLIDDERYAAFCEKRETIEKEIKRLNTTFISPSEVTNEFLRAHGTTEISSGASLGDMLRRPQLDYESISVLDPDRPALDARVIATVEVSVKYEGYIKRQIDEVKKFEKLERRLIPEDVDYDKVTGLRIEARQKLKAIRPASLGQASRISGVSPADVSVLLIYLSQTKE